MSEFLYHYHPVEPATWFYLSSLLTIGLFFKFSRLWSVRNLDILLLILLAPGLLFVHYGRELDRSQLEAASAAAAEAQAGDPKKPIGLVEGVADPATTEQPVKPPESANSPAPADEPVGEANRNNANGENANDSDASSDVVAATELAVDTARADDANSHSQVKNAEETHTESDANPSDDTRLGDTRPGDTEKSDLTATPPVPALPVPAPSDPEQPQRTAGERIQLYGYFWLFCLGGLLLVRLLADPTMVRRPLLEPNLSAGGLIFIGCSLFVFLMASVISRPERAETVSAATDNELTAEQEKEQDAVRQADGPGYALLSLMPSIAKKSLAILGHLTIVVGMVLIGYRHFDNLVMGAGTATLYLMLPYSALMTNEIKHVLPAASLVWAVLCYRRPLASGFFLGLAGGMSYYPLFLLPLWLSFYWPRGLVRFITGVVAVLVVLSFVLFSSGDVILNLRMMFGLVRPATSGLRGIWDDALGGWHPYYRIPVLAAFVVLASSMALWPAQKNLGTLLSCSAAVMVATQFWHGYGGGTYMAWYLPLLLLTIFRPNLEDRVALTVLAEGWLPKRFSVSASGKAA